MVVKSIHQSLKSLPFEITDKTVFVKEGKVVTPDKTLTSKEARDLSLKLLAAAIEAEEQ